MVISEMTNPVMNMYSGTKRLAFRKGLSVSMISFCTLTNRQKEMIPASIGVTTQLATMGPTPPQCTASIDTPTAAKPMTAPTMVCVVDTGQPRVEATISQVPAASNADIMPSTMRLGLIRLASTMPFLMVSVT